MRNNVKRNSSGFTLIEVIVTVAIIGILSAIGITAYDYYTQVTKRSAAKTALQQVRGLLEQYYTNNKSYTTNLINLGFQNSPLEIDKTGAELAAGSADIIYDISINTSTAGNLVYCASCDYEVVATAKNSQTNDTKCAVFVFDSLGQKLAYDSTNNPNTKCW